MSLIVSRDGSPGWDDDLTSPRVAARLLRRTLEAADDARPDDLPTAYRPGEFELRVLVYGDGPATSEGVPTHELGLAGATATAVQRRLDRGVRLDVLIREGPTGSDGLAALAARRPWRYDAVVLTLDLVAAAERCSAQQWRREVERLTQAVQHDVLSTTPVLIAPATGPGSPVGLMAVTAMQADLAGFDLIQLQTDGGSEAADHNRAEARYARWGDAIAGQLELAMASGAVHSGGITPARLRDLPDDEGLRQAALARSGLLSAQHDPFLQRIVDAARATYGTAGARINVIGADTQYTVASTSATAPPVTRTMSMCDVAIRSADATVVPDVAVDPRFSTNPFAVAPGGIGFYAAHPIESPDGYRVGTVCVFDPEARPTGGGARETSSGLRDLAFLVQRHLWEGLAPEQRQS